MIFIDTNVFVRLLVHDSGDMTLAAKRFVSENTCNVTKTVVLEASWVLSSNFKFTEEQILNAFEAAIGLPELAFEDGNAVIDAIEWARAGVEFEDAMHLASVPPQSELATFDKTFARRAERLSLPIRLLRVKP